MKATLAALTFVSLTFLAFGACAQDSEATRGAESAQTAEGVIVIDGESYQPDPAASKTLACVRYDSFQKKWVTCRVCRNGLCLVRIKKTRAGSSFKVTE